MEKYTDKIKKADIWEFLEINDYFGLTIEEVETVINMSND